MIVTEFYKGQGPGNQLACYVATRSIALDKGYSFGIMHIEKFTCASFMSLDFGHEVIGGSGPEGGPPTTLPHGITNYYSEKKVLHPITGADIRFYDEGLVTVPDDTKIDGIMQGEHYFSHRKDEIRQWLKVDLIDLPEDLCIINFRGGEYTRHPELFLNKKYWENAVAHMQKINPAMKFKVVTDDVKTAKQFFPGYEISHDLRNDYISIQSATYLILSNSSFAFFPAWLNVKVKLVIAPKYWARHNVSDGYWSSEYNITSGWHYLDREGNLTSYEQCVEDLKKYKTLGVKDTSPIRKGGSAWVILSKRIVRKVFLKSKYYFNKVANKLRYLAQVQKNNLLSKTQKPLSEQEVKEIAEYRKKIRIYDIFTYNGEADVLEMRLNILYPHVDQFIIVEAPTTFSGLKKPLYFQEQKNRFLPFMNKIQYHVIDDYPNDKALCEMARSSSNIPKDGPEHFIREFYQKESIKKALVGMNDNDICFVGDVDEIWNPDIIIDYRNNDIYKLRQIVYSYFLNNKSDEPWAGTLATKYLNIKNNCLNHLRTKHKTVYTYIPSGGWHFTNIGGLDAVRKKLEDQYTSESYKTKDVEENLEKRFGKSDYFGRNFKYIIDEASLPNYVIRNKKKYKNLFK